MRRAVALAVALAGCAVVLAGAALMVALHRPAVPPSRYPLVCGQAFTDGQTGRQVPMYVPCSAVRP